MNPSYRRLKPAEFFKEIDTEERAREWVWRSRFGGKDFVCPHCQAESFYALNARPEVRECRSCGRQTRVRAGTIFQDSKLPLLIWVRAVYFVMQGKRGISALELKRQLGMKSYGTAWAMLHKIRHAFADRDKGYKLKASGQTEAIELDGASFGRRTTGNEIEVLVAIESKDWVDERGRAKSRAGFAKVLVAPETKAAVQAFVDEAIETGATVNTDAKPALVALTGVETDHQVMNSDPKVLDRWLPWVHKFISNAKAWVIGTHHGVKSAYLHRYLAEYTYRFNRRHDPDSLFHRALVACAGAAPITLPALLG